MMKIDCIKTALADDIGIASIAFGCTHRKHTCQGEFPKTPEKNKSRKDDVNSWKRKQKENQETYCALDKACKMFTNKTIAAFSVVFKYCHTW